MTVRSSRLGRALGAALLVLTGCADTTDLAGTSTDDAASESIDEPTEEPTDEPTKEPTEEPTEGPTEEPTEGPTEEPTEEPTEPPVEPATRPQRGDCLSLTSTDVFYDVLREIPESKPCSQRHVGQITDVEPLSPAMRQAVDSGNIGPVTDRLQGRCLDSTQNWLGTDEEGFVISQFFSLPALPSYAQSQAGADWFACITYVIQRGTTLLALPRDTRRLLTDNTNSPYGTCARAAISNAGDDRVVCSITHNWRAVGAVKLGGPSASFDGENRVRERVRASCETQVRDYLDTTAAYEYGYTWPTRSLWNDGDRYGVCYAKVDV
jgi:hypothetical protein